MTLDEKKGKLFDYIQKVIETHKDKYPGLLMGQSEEALLNDVWEKFSELSYEQIVSKIDDGVERRIKKLQSNENETKNEQDCAPVVVNDLIYYQILGNTLHFHLTTKNTRELLKLSKKYKKSPSDFLAWAAEKDGLIDDAFKKIAKDIKEKNLNVDVVFAVSSILTKVVNGMEVKDFFTGKGFEYSGDEEGRFKKMFPGENLGQVEMFTEKFLECYGKDGTTIEALPPEILKEMQRKILPEIYATDNKVFIEKTEGKSNQNEQGPKDLE